MLTRRALRKIARTPSVRGAATALACAAALALAGTALTHRPTTAAATAPRLSAAPTVPDSLPPQSDWLGDSYTEGTGATTESTSYAHLVVHVRHWTIRNLAEGGTGYVNSGPQNLTGARYPVGQFIGSVIRDQPQYVFVAAGINDRTSVEDDHAVSFAQFQTIVNKDYDRLKAGLPGAKIVVIGPFWPRQGTTPGIVRINEIVKAAAASHGFPFLDPLGEHWITGTRDVPSSGNAARYILPDGTHPTPAGHRYLAERVLTDLKRLGV